MAVTMEEAPAGSRAIVVGSGVGGLAAAAAIAPRFHEVCVIEKDTLPEQPAIRKSIAQGGHLHSLLLGGLEVLETLMPGISAQLRAAGAVVLRAGIDQQIHENGRWLPERDLEETILAQSRFLLEHVIRRRVLEIPNVKISDGASVEQLVAGANGIASVVVKGRAGYADRQIDCDMLVDASGRGGRLVRHLAELHPGADHVQRARADIVYASAFLEKPVRWRERRENILIMAEPGFFAGGALIDIEGDRWCVSLNGRHGVVPPTEPEAWKAFARTLPDQRIWERIADAKLQDGVRLFRKPEITWRRFDQATSLPTNYFPLGDVITSIDPTFGQGMTVAFKHALELAHCLLLPLDERQQHYLKRANFWSEKAWRSSSHYSAGFGETDASQQRSLAMLKSLAAKRQAQACEDPVLHRQLFRSAQMLG